MSKRITTGMRIEAKRIGCKPTELGGGNLADARKIDRAINSAVRKERERCVLCVIRASPADYLARPYIDAINGTDRKKNAENVRMIERHDSGVRKATAKQLDKATKAIRKGKA